MLVGGVDGQGVCPCRVPLSSIIIGWGLDHGGGVCHRPAEGFHPPGCDPRSLYIYITDAVHGFRNFFLLHIVEMFLGKSEPSAGLINFNT